MIAKLIELNVQLLITILATDGTQTARTRAQISKSSSFDNRWRWIYYLHSRLKEGDFGWVLANDRDISLFLQNYNQSPPNTNRIKNFADGLFIPDTMKSYNIDDTNNDYMLLQSIDNKISIMMGVNPTKQFK